MTVLLAVFADADMALKHYTLQLGPAYVKQAFNGSTCPSGLYSPPTSEQAAEKALVKYFLT